MALLSQVKSFLEDKFWDPIANESEFYNPFNTTAYALIFAVVAAYLVKPRLKASEIDIDRKFVIAFTPFIFLGGALRTLKDVNIVNTVLLETPFIFFLMFGITGILLLASRFLDRNGVLEYHKMMGASGTFLLVIVLSLYSWTAPIDVFTTVFGLYAALILLTAGLTYAVRNKVHKATFFLPIAAHYWDGATSFTAIAFSSAPFWEVEKHVLGRWVMHLMDSIGVLPAVGMLVMKTAIIIPAVYWIETNVEDDFDRKYYLFLIALLGFALGTRNFIQIMA